MFQQNHIIGAGALWFRVHPGIRRLICIIAVALILWPYTLSFGDTKSTFRLVNGTSHYIDAAVSSQSYLFLAPGGSLLFDFTAPTTLYITINYSPGQEIRGNATRVFTATPVYHNQYSTDYHGSSDCSRSNSSKSSDCSSNVTESSTAYVTVAPIQWTVTADSLNAPGE